MGLDSVELLYDIEKEFGVEFTDEEAEKIITVRNMYEWLQWRTDSQITAPCLTQASFYRLRKVIAREFGVNDRSLNPNTLIRDLASDEFPEPAEKIKDMLLKRGWMKETQFVRSDRVKLILNFSFWGGIATGAGFALSQGSAPAVVLFSSLAFGSFFGITARLTIGKRKDSLPFKSLGQAVRRLAYGIINDGPTKGIHEDRLFLRLRAIISDRTGTPEEEILPEHSFAHDLGLD